MKGKKLKQNMSGITLIALVITIIVLLILAGVSISMISGDDGIVSQAANSKESTLKGEEQEFVNLAYSSAQIDSLGQSVTKEKMQEKLNNIAGTGKTEVAETDGTITIKFIETGNEYTVNGNTVSGGNSVLDEYKHPEQLVSTYIGIGTDGKPVNMDIWNPTLLENGTWSLGTLHTGSSGRYSTWYNCTNAYMGKVIDGKIEGAVPEYIYNEETGNFEPVTEMHCTFFGYEYGNETYMELKYAPEIPETVVDMEFAFSCCYSLIEASEIPVGVVNMRGTFYDCSSLIEAPEVPENVTNLEFGFQHTFDLTGTIKINSTKVSKADVDTFSDCGADYVSVPAGSITYSVLSSITYSGYNPPIIITH